MSTHSLDGREWAKLSALKPCDKIEADDGFPCIKKGAILTVDKDERGELFVPCSSGQHTLDGSLSLEDWDHLVGFWPAPEGEPAREPQGRAQ